MMKKSNKKGFTLVELIVVIAIMAILAAVLVPTVTSKIKDANESSAKSSVSALAESIRADIISASATSSHIFQGEYFAVKVTEGTKVEIGQKGETFAAATDALPLSTNSKIEVKNVGNEIEVYHKDYNKSKGWKYTIDHTGKVTLVDIA